MLSSYFGATLKARRSRTVRGSDMNGRQQRPFDPLAEARRIVWQHLEVVDPEVAAGRARYRELIARIERERGTHS